MAPTISVRDIEATLSREITATGSGTLTITRTQSHAGHTSTETIAYGTGSPLVVLDHDWELWPESTVYTVSDLTGTTSTAPMSSHWRGGCVLTVPRRPDLGRITAQIVTQPGWEWSGPGVALEVVGQPARSVDPARLSTRSGELVLHHLGVPPVHPGPDLVDLREMLRQGEPVLLRTMAPTRVESVLMHIDRVRDEAWSPPDALRRRLTVEWTQVEDPGWRPVLIGQTWATVGAQATWATIGDLGANWQELAWP